MTHPIKRMGLTRSNLVAALFLKPVSARDAIADLKIAGFHSSDIGVAISRLGQREQERSPNAVQAPGDLDGKHSIRWKVRHSSTMISTPTGAVYRARRMPRQPTRRSLLIRKLTSRILCGAWGSRKIRSRCWTKSWGRTGCSSWYMRAIAVRKRNPFLIAIVDSCAQ